MDGSCIGSFDLGKLSARFPQYDINHERCRAIAGCAALTVVIRTSDAKGFHKPPARSGPSERDGIPT